MGFPTFVSEYKIDKIQNFHIFDWGGGGGGPSYVPEFKTKSNIPIFQGGGVGRGSDFFLLEFKTCEIKSNLF